MFEFEVNHGYDKSSALPADVQKQFTESTKGIAALSLMAWEEHCTECAMPACYKTCDLYEPRKDGKCRRFHHGFEKIPLNSSMLGYVSRVSFKRWGSVMASADLHLVPSKTALRTTTLFSLLDRFASAFPDGWLSIAGRKGVSSRLMRRLKYKIVRSRVRAHRTADEPTAFLAEIYNPQSAVINVSFTIRDQGELSSQPFQQLLELKPGFNRVEIPFENIRPHIEPGRKFWVTLCPNLLEPKDEGLTLYFGLMSFVTLAASPEVTTAEASHPPPPYNPGVLPDGVKHIKAVAWDLDNTVWQGILLEDGAENLVLRPQVAEVMRELDRRGIINSVVSKNEPESVKPLLDKFGLSEYIVFPKVGWQPKSESVSELINTMNVGANTIAVIDDSPFERLEIEQRCPGVRVYPHDQYLEVLYLPEFRPPLSAESSKRREFYRAEEQRKSVVQSSAGSYEDFLRECDIHMDVQVVHQGNLDRAHELVQRTNQLNFSGNRYSRSDVHAMLDDPDLLPLSISCHDKFGAYGLVGFCVVNKREALVKDLMFSCRVQAKGVEHAFLRHLGAFLRTLGHHTLRAKYFKTKKNTQAAKVFDDLGFSEAEVDTSQENFLFEIAISKLTSHDEIITVNWEVESELVA